MKSYKEFKIGDIVDIQRGNETPRRYVICGFTPMKGFTGGDTDECWIDVAEVDNPTVEVEGYLERVVTLVHRPIPPIKLDEDLFNI